MKIHSPISELPHIDADNIGSRVLGSRILSPNVHNIPVLNDVVGDDLLDDLSGHLTTQVLLELEPQLRELVHRAFTDTVRMVALDLKHAFEREFDKQLYARLRVIVEESVQRAYNQVNG